jgi:hypothetical protein
MSEFRSENFGRIVCGGCGEATTIEPGQIYAGLNCTCGEPIKGSDTEKSTPVQEELDYIKTQTVIVIGMFKNGDYEVCNGNDLSDTWRVPKETFENTYEVKINEAPAPKATNEKKDSLPKGSDSLAKVK